MTALISINAKSLL